MAQRAPEARWKAGGTKYPLPPHRYLPPAIHPRIAGNTKDVSDKIGDAFGSFPRARGTQGGAAVADPWRPAPLDHQTNLSDRVVFFASSVLPRSELAEFQKHCRTVPRQTWETRFPISASMTEWRRSLFLNSNAAFSGADALATASAGRLC